MEILYSDEHLLAVNKPSGLAVHRGWTHERDTLVERVRQHLGGGTVHLMGRLDRGASGIVVFARNPDVTRTLQATLAEPDTEKRYWVLVRGIPPPEGVIDHAIPNDEDGPRVPAKTSFRTLESIELEPRALSLVEAVLHSGRLHQIRRHMKHINHPVIGDSKHGRLELNRAFRDLYGLGRMALHAHTLTFLHPATGLPVTIQAPMPEDLVVPLKAMGFHIPGLAT